MDPKKMEKQLAFFKKINEYLKAEGKKEISENSIASFFADSNREKTHEAAKRTFEIQKEKNKVLDEVEKEIDFKGPGINLYQRNMYSHMDISGTKEANEKNKEILNKIADPKECSKIISNQFKEVMKLDYNTFFSPEGSLAGLVNEYVNNTKTLDDAFVAFNFGKKQFGEHIYDPRLNAIFDNKPIIESLDSGKNAVIIASHGLYKALPDEAFDLDTIQTLMAHVKDLETEFPDIMKENDINFKSLSDVLSCSASIQLNKKIGKLLADNKLPDPKTILTDYHFELNGERVPYYKFSTYVQDHNSMGEFSIVQNSKEEIKALHDALNSEAVFGTYEDMTKNVNFMENSKLRSEATKEIVSKIKVDLTKNEEISDEEMEKLHSEPTKTIRAKQHERAIKIKERQLLQNQTFEDIQQELGVKIAGGPAIRVISTYIDTSNTKEAREKNEALIIKASSEEGMREICNEALKEILNLKVSDIFSKDQSIDGYLDHAEAFDDICRRSWIIKNIVGNNAIDYRIEEAFNANSKLLEVAETGNAIDFIASDLYEFIPDKMINNPKACDALLTKLPDIAKDLSKVDKRFDITNLSNGAINLNIFAKSKATLFTRDMIKEGKIDDIFKGKFSLNGETDLVDIEEAYKKDKNVNIKYEEFSEFTRKEVKEALKGNILMTNEKYRDNIEDLFRSLEGKNGNILNTKNGIKKTHSIFSRDTKQFKEMEASLANVAKIVNDFKDVNNKDLNSIGKQARDLKAALKDLQDKTKTYRDKKQKEKETQKKFSTRSQDRLDLANSLLKIVDDTMNFDKIKINDNPFRKPLAMDKVQKLEAATKEKEVVKETQKVINEPTKQTNLEQGARE